MGVFGFVASGGGSIGVLLGGVLTDVPRLALDLPRQPADRRRRGAALAEAAAGPQRRGRQRPARRRRRGHGDRVADARRLRDRQRQPGRLALGGDARAARRAVALLALFLAIESRVSSPLDAARPVPPAQRRDRERRRRALGRGDVRLVLPLGALPAARARLQPAEGRPRVPARQHRHGHPLGGRLGEARDALRHQAAARGRAAGRGGRARCCSRARPWTAASSWTCCRA